MMNLVVKGLTMTTTMMHDDSDKLVSESEEEEPEWSGDSQKQRSYHGIDSPLGGMSGDERRA